MDGAEMSKNRPSATDFRDPLLRALEDLAGSKPNRPVNLKDTYEPICQEMGIRLAQFGQQKNTGVNWVEKWIQWAFRNLRKEGLGVSAGRGKWALTPQGVRVAGEIKGKKVTNMPDPNPPVQGVSLNVGPGNNTDDAYHPDPYIRALAAENTKCFGYYTNKSGSKCERCPIQGMCKNAMAAKLSTLARQLAEEDAQEKNPKPKSKPDAETKAPAKKGGGSSRWGKAQTIIAQQQAICRACGGTIEQGDQCQWVKSSANQFGGLFHQDCYGDEK